MKGEDSEAAFFLLPLWEKVARPKAVTDEGLPGSEPVAPLTRLEHASRVRSTLSHKGRGKEERRARGHFASSFRPSRISIAVSAPSPAMREAPAMAAAACGWP